MHDNSIRKRLISNRLRKTCSQLYLFIFCFLDWVFVRNVGECKNTKGLSSWVLTVSYTIVPFKKMGLRYLYHRSHDWWLKKRKKPSMIQQEQNSSDHELFFRNLKKKSVRKEKVAEKSRGSNLIFRVNNCHTQQLVSHFHSVMLPFKRNLLSSNLLFGMLKNFPWDFISDTGFGNFS